jgi:hypothetical protein
VAGDNLQELLGAIVNAVNRYGDEDAIHAAVTEAWNKYTGQDTTVSEDDESAEAAPAESVPADDTGASESQPVTTPAPDPGGIAPADPTSGEGTTS